MAQGCETDLCAILELRIILLVDLVRSGLEV